MGYKDSRRKSGPGSLNPPPPDLRPHPDLILRTTSAVPPPPHPAPSRMPAGPQASLRREPHGISPCRTRPGCFQARQGSTSQNPHGDLGGQTWRRHTGRPQACAARPGTAHLSLGTLGDRFREPPGSELHSGPVLCLLCAQYRCKFQIPSAPRFRGGWPDTAGRLRMPAPFWGARVSQGDFQRPPPCPCLTGVHLAHNAH